MDNLCHTLAGAALGEAGLKRCSARGLATLVIASNLPDVDVAVFVTDTLAMSFRRGWTHGVLAQAVLPALFAGLMLGYDRLMGRGTARTPANLRGLLLLSYVGTLLHVFMDFLNSYGVRLLMPFSNRWFYGDALYVIDPVLYLVFGAAMWRSWRLWESGATDTAAPARIGLAVAFAYMGLMLGSNLWARAEVRDGLTRAGRPTETRFMVTPVFANPLRREVVIDTGARYEKGQLWFEPLPHFRPSGYGVDTNTKAPEVARAARTPRFAAYLRWSRFPFFIIDRTGRSTRVYLNDYRYSGPSGREGWSAVETDLGEE